MMTYSQAVKIQNKKPVRLHHCSVLNKLTVLSFDNFITFANLKLLCVHNRAPQVLTDLVVLLKLWVHCRREDLLENARYC